jgi:ATP-dependent Clp protease ATP-binding subunit ClpB
MLKEEVGPDDIAEVVQAWTGIPRAGCSRARRRSSADEEELGRRVVGQPDRRRAVSDAVAGASGVADPDRPRPAPSLFLGPDRRRQDRAGQGAAEFLFDDERAMDRIDMSELLRGSTRWPAWSVPLRVRRLRGRRTAHRGGARRPYTSSCFDEVEKGPQDVFDVLLQVLDDGRLTTARAARSTSGTPS